MSSFVKSFALVLIALLLSLALFSPMVYSQTSRSYISRTGRMGTYYMLNVYSPNDQITYNSTLPLNFTLEWRYDVLPMFEFSADYAYCVDSGSFVSIVPNNQSSNDRFVSDDSTFVFNPSFFYLIDISNLSSGDHNIVIKAVFYFGKNLFLEDSSTPFSFKVQNANPPIPEFPAPIFLPLFTAILLAAIILKKVNLKRFITRINSATSMRLP